MRRSRTAIACVLALAALTAPDLAAQIRGGAGSGMPGGAMRGPGRGDPGAAMREQRPATQEFSEAEVEYRLDLLREDLKLEAGQLAAWQVYAERVKAMASDISRERTRSQTGAEAGVMARIDNAVDSARNRLTALEDIASAAKALYAALSPAQQTVADPRLATLIPTGASTTSQGARERFERRGAR